MLLEKEKKFLEKYNVKQEKNTLLMKLCSYEKKYNLNSFDVLFNKEKYLDDPEIMKWIQYIEFFLEGNGDVTQINTINKIDIIRVEGSDEKLFYNLMSVQNKILVISCTNILLKKVIAYSLMKMNFVYVLSPTKTKFSDSPLIQTLVTESLTKGINEFVDYSITV